jgi:cysteine sulfinate desulfinase/cysteine desulfurase-like protein
MSSVGDRVPGLHQDSPPPPPTAAAAAAAAAAEEQEPEHAHKAESLRLCTMQDEEDAAEGPRNVADNHEEQSPSHLKINADGIHDEAFAFR